MAQRPNLFAKITTKNLSKAISLSFLVMLMVACDKEVAGETKVTDKAKAPIVRPALIEVVSATAMDGLSFNGVVQATQRADLSFRVGGLVNQLLVKEGDAVKKGQLLARLDDKDAQTFLASERLELKNVEAEYKRSKAIYDKTKAISKSQLDEITTRYNLAKNHVDEAQRQLSYTKIISPFTGVVGRQFIDNYTQVQANTPIYALHDLNALEIEIQIPDKVVLSYVSGSEAKAQISGIDTLFDLNLRTFATQANPVTQTYSVVLSIDDLKDYRVLPGMVAKVIPVNTNNVNPDTQSKNTSITLPLVAVVPNNQGQQYVWVVDENNKVSKRFIEVGVNSLDRIEIKNNLQVGERVVIAGVSSLQEGMEIRPMLNNEAK